MTLKNTAWVAALAATTLSLGAYAQDPADPTAPPTSATPEQRQSMPPAQVGAIDDKKIEQFADAYLAVQSIQQKAANELQTTTDPAAADKVKQNAESAMIAAVEQSGLKVDEFNQIVESMAADANVRARVTAELQERTGGG
jgi:Domain of unknown function (DUF4168)